MDCTKKLIKNICAKASQVGGLTNKVYIGQLPISNLDFDSEGRVYGFSPKKCFPLVKAIGRQDKFGFDSAVTDTDSGAITTPTLTVRFYHGGDQCVIDQISALLRSENLFAIIEQQDGYFRIIGLENGMRVTAGAGEQIGVLATDPNQIEFQLTGQSTRLEPIFRRGTVAETLAYLDGLTELDGTYIWEKLDDKGIEYSNVIKSQNVNGTIFLSTDLGLVVVKNGGKSFTLVNSSANSINYFISQLVGFRLVPGTNQFTLEKTLNGGFTWTVVKTYSGTGYTPLELVMDGEGRAFVFFNTDTQYIFEDLTIGGSAVQYDGFDGLGFTTVDYVCAEYRCGKVWFTIGFFGGESAFFNYDGSEVIKLKDILSHLERVKINVSKNIYLYTENSDDISMLEIYFSQNNGISFDKKTISVTNQESKYFLFEKTDNEIYIIANINDGIAPNSTLYIYNLDSGLITFQNTVKTSILDRQLIASAVEKVNNEFYVFGNESLSSGTFASKISLNCEGSTC